MKSIIYFLEIAKQAAVASSIILLAAFANTAAAGVVTVGFDDLDPSINRFANFVSHNVIFSPSCHFHNDDRVEEPSAGVAPYGKYLSWDQSGCYDRVSAPTLPNANYLGPTGWQPGVAKMFVALESGDMFSLQSLIFASRIDGGRFSVTSSKGGMAIVDYNDGGNFALKTFQDEAWTNVTWLEFVRISGSDIPFGFDNLTLASNSLPEPTSGALYLLAIGAAALASRWRSHQNINA